jgi:hypothetical protein
MRIGTLINKQTHTTIPVFEQDYGWIYVYFPECSRPVRFRSIEELKEELDPNEWTYRTTYWEELSHATTT